MTTSEEKRSAFIEASNRVYLAGTAKTAEELNKEHYNKADFVDGITGNEFKTIEDAMIAGEEAATLILEEEREQIEASKAAAALGRKGGKSRSDAKRKAGAKNCKKLNADPAVRKARSERMKAMWAKKKAQHYTINKLKFKKN